MPATAIEGQPKTGNEETGDELRDALNKASDEVDAAEETEGTDDETPSSDDEPSSTKKGKKDTSAPDDDDDEDDEETRARAEESERAIKFYRSITNPETAEQVLNSIAKRAGYELKSLTTGQRDAMVDEIEHVLRSELGDEFALLPANLGKALSKIIDSRVGKTRSEIEQINNKLAASEEGLRRAAVDEALAWASTEYPEFEAQNKKILREMKAFPPSPNMNAREYIKKICKLADVAPKQSVDNSRSDRVRSNKEGQKPSDGVRGERSTKVANSLAEAAALAFEEQFPNER